jgi:hypothetical protein
MEKLNLIEVAAMPAAASENQQSRPFGRSFREPQMQREAQGHRQASSEPEWMDADTAGPLQDGQAEEARSRKDVGGKCGPQGQASQPERLLAERPGGESKERPLEPPGARKGFPETDPTA